MDIQQILVYLVVAAALVYIIRKFFWKKTRAKGEQSGAKSKKDCGDDDCGCH
ncbi:MAG: FeoB-associated Cys-rich membrane protein [Bacteroidota bacterium]